MSWYRQKVQLKYAAKNNTMEEDEEVDIVGGLDDFMSKNEREM